MSIIHSAFVAPQLLKPYKRERTLLLHNPAYQENMATYLRAIQQIIDNKKSLAGVYYEYPDFSSQYHNEKSIRCRKTVVLGPIRESNPGPLAPEARIIPLDQQATCYTFDYSYTTRAYQENMATYLRAI